MILIHLFFLLVRVDVSPEYFSLSYPKNHQNEYWEVAAYIGSGYHYSFETGHWEREERALHWKVSKVVMYLPR